MGPIGPREGFQKSPKPPNLGLRIRRPTLWQFLTNNYDFGILPRITMPKLRGDEQHNCPLCPYHSQRVHLKTHLTKVKKNGNPKCPGLKKAIPSDVWNKQIVPHYTKDGPLPDLSSYERETPKPRGRKRTKSMEDMDNDARRKFDLR